MEYYIKSPVKNMERATGKAWRQAEGAKEKTIKGLWQGMARKRGHKPDDKGAVTKSKTKIFQECGNTKYS